MAQNSLSGRERSGRRPLSARSLSSTADRALLGTETSCPQQEATRRKVLVPLGLSRQAGQSTGAPGTERRKSPRPSGVGAAGAALGTTLSQTISVVIAFTAIYRGKTGIVPKRQYFKLQPEIIRQILKIGIPVAVQDGFIQISFIVITVIANRRGLNDAAAVGIVEKIIGIVFLVPSTMLSTVSALSAQNIGAGKHGRAVLTLRYAVFLAAGFGLAVSVLVQWIAEPVVGMFTDEAQAVVLGGQYLRSYIWDCMFAGMHFSFSGYFCAYGMSGISFLHNFLSIVCVRIPGAYLASKYFADTLFPMGMAAPGGSLLSVAVCVIAFVWMRRRDGRLKTGKEHGNIL